MVLKSIIDEELMELLRFEKGVILYSLTPPYPLVFTHCGASGLTQWESRGGLGIFPTLAVLWLFGFLRQLCSGFQEVLAEINSYHPSRGPKRWPNLWKTVKIRIFGYFGAFLWYVLIWLPYVHRVFFYLHYQDKHMPFIRIGKFLLL